MKFIWTFEFNPEESEEISKKNKELDKLIEAEPDKYPKLHPSYMIGLGQGFRIIEAVNEDQIMRLVMHFYPLENWNMEPIFEGQRVSKIWREIN